ncbi:UNVERIFIED_CONTAM: hypothetical protein Sangu_3068800 [Sesamum angustifolium]|uniref:DUF4283 domain-containing protein n=1 Tax=Sesamum angustifolium TaxID=2727405 RepID=A0AAW2KDG7_9LAMI
MIVGTVKAIVVSKAHDRELTDFTQTARQGFLLERAADWEWANPNTCPCSDDGLRESVKPAGAEVIPPELTTPITAGTTVPIPADLPAAKPIKTTGIFIGNVPLNAHGSDFHSCVKFAASFNNSTRRTLSYVSPSIQNGEVVLRPSTDVVREGSRRWDCTAIGYFLGRKPYYHHLNDYIRKVWPVVKEVTATSNGFYFFQFKMEIAMEKVIEGGPWLFQGQPIVLQRWEPGMVLRKHKHTQVPVWIRLRHLPVEFWTNDGLSTVASGVGRPLYQDSITRACTRLDSACVCVMLDILSTLPKHLIIMMPKKDGSETPYKAPVAVYVQKRPSTTQPLPNANPNVTIDTVHTVNHTAEVDKGVERNNFTDKGKAIVVYNPFDALLLTDDDVGLNRRDPQVAVRELASEFRLHFIGLLETRVSASNVMRIQTFLPIWSWFTNYNGPGNRIWIAWDAELLDVDVLNLDVQFIHCRITIRSAHLSVLTTVVYGANDTISRRDLWQNLSMLAQSISDKPWIVGGDFNTVLDMSEWPNSHYHCLNARTSDHSPLVIQGDADTHTNVWRHRIEDTSMYAVTRKLRALKPVFRTLRRKKGDLSLNVKLAAEFLGTVAMRRASKRLFQIMDEDGHTHTTQYDVVNEFVSFYQRLLGGERRREFIDLRYLQPWARHILTLDECRGLVQSVTREEIKDAFFDIAEHKAPGPNGYSSGFYKAV